MNIKIEMLVAAIERGDHTRPGFLRLEADGWTEDPAQPAKPGAGQLVYAAEPGALELRVGDHVTVTLTRE